MVGIGFQDQVERIDRLMTIVNSPNQTALTGHLQFEDILAFACQSMWHLQDWVLNDPNFNPKSKAKLRADIHREPCLRVCSDLANGSKHLVLTDPKTSVSMPENAGGVHLDTAKGLFQVRYYLRTPDRNDPFHGMEIRKLLAECRAAWQRIIDKHYLSAVD